MLHRILSKSNVVGRAASSHPGRVSHVTWTHDFIIRFDEADPAGIAFFSHALRHHHHAYESLVVERLKIPYGEWFQNPAFGIPIKSSETEHFAPLLPGHRYSLQLIVSALGEHGFTLEGAIVPFDSRARREADPGGGRTGLAGESSGQERPMARIRTVHVFIDAKTRKKIAIPAAFRRALGHDA